MMQTVIDWTPRKGPASENVTVSDGMETPNSSSSADANSPATSVEAPFAFVKKQRRCRLACCTALARPTGFDINQEVISIQSTCIIFIPPPCAVSWFSGISAAYVRTRKGDENEDDDKASEVNKEEDDDPFMERIGRSTGIAASPVSSETLGIIGHEVEIDDCLRCNKGGYQHFKVTVTLPSRGLQGVAVVERTGGDMVVLESLDSARKSDAVAVSGSPCPPPCLRFDTTQSLGDAAAEPLIRRYFPSVVRRIEDVRAPQDAPAEDCGSVLRECVVCIGTLTLVNLPLIRVF